MPKSSISVKLVKVQLQVMFAKLTEKNKGEREGQRKEGDGTHVTDIIPSNMPMLVPCFPGSAILAAHAL